MDDYRNSPTIKFCADLFLAHRCPSAIKFKFKIRLECASVNWPNVLFISKACFPANKNELNVKSEWEIAKNSTSYFHFLWFRINYSWNWECFDQSCVNRTETVHGTLRLFPVFISPIVWNMCENHHYETVYFKELHNEQIYHGSTIYIQSGGSCSVNYY